MRIIAGYVLGFIAVILFWGALFDDDRYFTPAALFAATAAWLIYG